MGVQELLRFVDELSCHDDFCLGGHFGNGGEAEVGAGSILQFSSRAGR